MTDYLLRMEGVNIYRSVADTRQLSVRRGASLLLRQAVLDVAAVLVPDASTTRPAQLLDLLKKAGAVADSAACISTGASSGLFRLDVSSEKAAVLRDTIAAWLSDAASYRHLTFVVDIAPYNKTQPFTGNVESVVALNRYRQFTQPTLAMPDINDRPDVLPCAWDNLRPALIPVDAELDGSSRDYVQRAGLPARPAISQSAQRRHQYGRDQKREFFSSETDATDSSIDFTWNLQELSRDARFGFLSGKLAMIYVDGNSFGAVQRQCSSDAELRTFDQTIKQYRKDFLRELVTDAVADNTFTSPCRRNHQTIENAVRLEILLWGGDEFILVVPAWKGMQVIQNFFSSSANLQFAGGRLTHAAGLVFFDARTPITRIEQLARDMADDIKEQQLGDPADGCIDPAHPNANRFNYLVLESVDYPVQPFNEFVKQKYRGRQGSVSMTLQTGGLSYAGQSRLFRQLQQGLPRRQLQQLAHAAVYGQFDSAMERFRAAVPAAPQLEKHVAALFPGDDSATRAWIHLAELWDYYAPEPAVAGEQSGE